MLSQVGSDNHRQNCWDTLRRVVYIRPPLPQYNVESAIFLHSLLIDPNIAWWGRGRYGMLEDSLDFMSKKAWFQHVTLNVNTVQLIHHFWGSVPTTFDEHCLWKCLKKSTEISFSPIKQKRNIVWTSNLEDLLLVSLSCITQIYSVTDLKLLGIGHLKLKHCNLS